MAVRNQHCRQSKNYIIEKINGVFYYIEPKTGLSKSLIYSAKRNIKAGILSAPESMLKSGKTILVLCIGQGKYNFELI